MKLDYMNWVDRNWSLLGRAVQGHVAVYRLSGGLIGHRFPGAPPMLLLDSVGVRSGKRHTSPLVYARDGEDVILTASKGGHPHNPAWFHNLAATPDTTIQVGPRRRKVHARVAEPEERTRLWPLVVAVYGGYEDYRRRTEREIPLVVLEPR